MLLNILSVHLFGDKYVLKCNKKIDEIKMGYLFLIHKSHQVIYSAKINLKAEK
jgi:hypothetical protein